jgi:glycosyltransferase involved in cell wall biosynthesis
MWSHLVFAIKLWARALPTRWDVVVISSVPPDGLIAARFIRKRALVIDIRDIWPDALQSYGEPSRAARAFGTFCDAIYRATLRRAERIMIVAPGFRRWLARYGALKHGRVKFVPLGFRREDFRPLSHGGTEWDFCYAGGATPQFDIREFAPDFAKRHGIVLGSGPLLEAWKKAFPNSEFRGAVPRDKAMALMADSCQLLFPSNPFAQLPNKAFDYFALGHPVVLGDRCTRATRSLLNLRRRRVRQGSVDCWEDYRTIEKQALAQRAASIIEDAIH